MYVAQHAMGVALPSGIMGHLHLPAVAVIAGCSAEVPAVTIIATFQLARNPTLVVDPAIQTPPSVRRRMGGSGPSCSRRRDCID